uniref:DUF5641 domain-containing protein n=1 Tax=Wuchereria bancrofti TaxID=6293 RepID=A0AAF5RTL0_WUCBA
MKYTSKIKTPRAPWSGGVYERLIGLTKNAMRKSIGRKLLWQKELITLMVEIEGILNTRPLTYVSFDDYVVIRPIDFISPNAPLVTQIFSEKDQEEYTPYRMSTQEKLINYWSHTNEALDHFWELWKREYLNSLKERSQKNHTSTRLVNTREPSEQEIVLVNEPEIARGMWKLAKIKEKCYIEMPNGRLLHRLVNMLYPLEVEDNKIDQQPTSEASNQNSEPEEPIARRTRRVTQIREGIRTISNSITNCLILMSLILITTVKTNAKQDCKWISGIPFNMPHKWDCNEITQQNVTLTQVTLYTRTHIRIPAIKCSNITRTVCTKAFLRLSLSVVSDETIISAISSHLCLILHNQKELNGSPLTKIKQNKWTTNNNVQYSYGWLGIRYQSTSNFILEEGSLLLYDAV